MRKTAIQRALPLLLCLMLIAAAVFIATGCGSAQTDVSEQPQTVSGQSQAAEQSAEASQPESGTLEPAAKTVGEGETVFTFVVTYKDGTSDRFEVHTNETTVGAALQKAGLIEGEESQYGLYVKKVNGVLADYDTDGTYWAFYVNGQYATAGVDATDVTAGAEYGFKVE